MLESVPFKTSGKVVRLDVDIADSMEFRVVMVLPSSRN